MSSFTENVNIRPLPQENLWETTKDFVYYVGFEGSEDKITVPKGFKFDGMTIPKFLGWFAQKVEPKTLSSSAIHDYLYIHRRYNRRKTDWIFYESLVVGGTRKRKAFIMWFFVMLFGRTYRYKFI